MAESSSLQSPSLEADDDTPPKKPMGPNFEWNGSGREPAAEESPSQSDNDEGPHGPPSSKAPAPMQKRRRVTRACDECRRKKIKCDGRQPCTHCTVYSYDCTYDQPSNRRRNPAPQYIEAIENRLHRAEALLKTVMPDVDLNDPNILPATALAGPNFPQPGYEKNAGARSMRQVKTEGAGSEGEKDSMLESMVQSTGDLSMDDKGHYDFYGHSSGLVFLNRLRQQFGDPNDESDVHANMAAVPNSRHLSQVLDSPRSTGSPMESGLPNLVDLPSKACARHLCEIALKDAFALMRFVHYPTFYAMFDRIYDTSPDQWGNEENLYLPLLYAILSVGSIFAKPENRKPPYNEFDAAIESGFKYFRASRQMMDITDCRELPSLQAILCMILFLQSSAKLVTCYSYIGIALHSAIRMGLHRHIRPGIFNPVDSEIRKRIFWQIWKMNIYVGALLGLPMTLSDDDIDQDEPSEIDDEFITTEEILPMPEGYVPLACAMTAHTRLVRILRKVVIHVYPIKGARPKGRNEPQTYSVSHAKIREIEHDLQEWQETLPEALKPGGKCSPELTRVQQLLRIGYGHVQIFLYRPFLHYTSHNAKEGKVDKRSYASAVVCVNVARNVIHITAEMNKRGLLVGAYWFTVYTNFLAILSLVFFVFENLNNASSMDILKDAQEGKRILAGLAKKSMAADRCNNALTALFKSLEKFREGRSMSVARKRQASPNPGAASVKLEPNSTSNTPPKIHSSITVPRHKLVQQPQRASTFPNNPPFPPLKRLSYPYPGGDSYSQSSQDVYTPTTSSVDRLTPDSTSSNGAANGTTSFNQNPSAAFLQQQTQSQQQPNLFSPTNPSGLSDLGAMMFPSADPFAYPNQPMTTLEANHHLDQYNDVNAGVNGRGSISQQSQSQSYYNSPSTLHSRRNPSLTTNDGNNSDGSSTVNSATTAAGGANGGAEVQFFGPMPPYLMQGGQQTAGLMGGMDLGNPMGLDVGLGVGGFVGLGGFDASANGAADALAGMDVWDGMLEEGAKQEGDTPDMGWGNWGGMGGGGQAGAGGADLGI